MNDFQPDRDLKAGNTLSGLIKKLYENDVMRYIFFGGCTTLVNLATFWCLRKVGMTLNLANLISIIAAVLFAYVVNSRYVFHQTYGSLREQFSPFVKFIGARAVTMVIELGGVWLLVEKMHLPDMGAKILITIIVLISNYLFSKFLVFTQKR